MRLLPSKSDSRTTRGDGLSKLEARLQGHTLRLYRMPSHERAALISLHGPDQPQYETVGEDEKETPPLSQSGGGDKNAILRFLFTRRPCGLLQVFKDIQGAIQ